ncbi:MAG: MOSC domain-containing protein [Gammaproteobacteria bacterium]|jgi:MOSC domain-containing protein YiiM|nr:MOSC domain-containing protein [Gammaproteobacteria bacterium]
MTKLNAQVVSVHAGSNDDMSKEEHASIEVALDGIVGDAHQSYTRKTWSGDKQPEGTLRRNERQWSAVSVEELAAIKEAMDLKDAPTPTEVGANLCLSGIRDLSRLPKGTVLKFPSGAELIVEEYNPPCHDMGKKLAGLHETRSGEALSSTAFSKAAKLTRGIVGVVEVPGLIRKGDEVRVELYETPSWLLRSPD